MKARGPKLYKKGKHSGEIVKDDFKFVPRDPEVGFDPKHNKRVVEMTIKKQLAREKAIKQEFLNNYEERADAAASFLKALERGAYAGATSDSAAQRYFGKRQLAKLRGQENMDKIKASMGGLIK